MDSSKLSKWEDQLLDLSKRNNLINFKDTKSSTVEVVFPSPDEIFREVNESTTLEVYDPKIAEDDTDDDPLLLTDDQQADPDEVIDSERKIYIAEYARKLKKNQILIYNQNNSPLTTLRNIDKRARSFIDETGVNVLYMSFGFIDWKEADESNIHFRAPLLLVPIQLYRESALRPYKITMFSDDIQVNPTFDFMLRRDHDVSLPTYEDDERLHDYLDEVRQLVSKLNWTVVDGCRISIFSFLKLNMYQDLKDNSDLVLSNDNVRALLGEDLSSDFDTIDDDYKPLTNPIVQLHNVVDADSSQIEAIEMAKSGKSFALQGPPGTGKSQTITNIIAECIYDGKKVLFVSEKLSALNVVYDNLKKAGLGEFCLQLHSYKANKKEVISDICDTLRSEGSDLNDRAAGEIKKKEEAQRQLDGYVHELHERRPTINLSLYELYERHASVRNAPDVEYPISALESKGEDYLNRVAELLDQYVDFIPTIGYDYHNNPWYGCTLQDISYQNRIKLKNALTEVIEFLDDLIPLQDEIQKRYEIKCTSIQDARCWRDFFSEFSSSTMLSPSLLDKDVFDKVYSKLDVLEGLSRDIISDRERLYQKYDEDIYRLDGKEGYKRLSREFSNVFTRLFSREYKNLINELNLCKKDGKKPSYKEALDDFKTLAGYTDRYQEFTEKESDIKRFLVEYNGVDTDWNELRRQMSPIRNMIDRGYSFGDMSSSDDLEKEQSIMASYADKLRQTLSECGEETSAFLQGCFDSEILEIDSHYTTSLSAKLKSCLDDLDELDNYSHFYSLLGKLEEADVLSYIDVTIRQNIRPDQIVHAYQKLFYHQWIDDVCAHDPVLHDFTKISQQRAVDTFKRTDVEQFEINRADIRSHLSSLRPSPDMIAPGSPLSILLRENEKKRKQMSIRPLLSATGDLVLQIKPCFLMSPLSVSTYLDPQKIHFDVVIFDEASQIFPQDALGSIYRGKQLIVVGDSRQMPPSNFFNTSAEASDSDEYDGGDDVTAYESILDICTAVLPHQLSLSWHYRSRSEQLIAFSNKNFYSGKLITFPNAEADGQNRGVKYHHVDGGIFDRSSHTNRREAEYVVDLIYDHIRRFPYRSLGVVAFSIAQSNLIDRRLSKRRQMDPEFEEFFQRDCKEPFFIKNLETVQGDERDSIILSVAYGPDSTGRILHNFGPLNRQGGERRLNVAITRAKEDIHVVSSMHHLDIDLKKTSSEGARLLRDYLNYAENGEIALDDSLSVKPFDEFDSAFEMEVCDFLRERGYSVDTQVGCSGFRIDMGVKRPDSSDYVLAIECDGATYHSSKNARDRDRLRQQILERMGWKFYRIWSTDWFRNKAQAQEDLLVAVKEALARAPSVSSGDDEAVDMAEENFEKPRLTQGFHFPDYQMVDVDKWYQECRRQYGHVPFLPWLKGILDAEAPLSEEWFLRRIVSYFKREKVTSEVKRQYESLMRDYERYGIERRDGFLYLRGKEIKFRDNRSVQRDIRQIAPEELADGLLQILMLNRSSTRTGLYKTLAKYCGKSSLSSGIIDRFDGALNLLGHEITIDHENDLVTYIGRE